MVDSKIVIALISILSGNCTYYKTIIATIFVYTLDKREYTQ